MVWCAPCLSRFYTFLAPEEASTCCRTSPRKASVSSAARRTAREKAEIAPSRPATGAENAPSTAEYDAQAGGRPVDQSGMVMWQRSRLRSRRKRAPVDVVAWFPSRVFVSIGPTGSAESSDVITSSEEANTLALRSVTMLGSGVCSGVV